MLRRKKYYSLLVVAILVFKTLLVSTVIASGTIPEVSITKLQVKPIIDGKIDDDAWVEVARSFKGVLSGWKNQSGSVLAQNQRIVYLGYDDEALYIAMTCYVDNIESLIVGDSVWDDDHFEVHLVNTNDEYFQLGVTSSGRWALGRLNKLFRFQSAVHIGNNYWSVEVKIPWREVRVIPEVDTKIRFNVAARDYLDNWVTWGPTYGGFQKPENFAILKLE